MGKNAICSKEEFYGYQLEVIARTPNIVLKKHSHFYGSVLSMFLLMPEPTQEELRIQASFLLETEEQRTRLKNLWLIRKSLLED